MKQLTITSLLLFLFSITSFAQEDTQLIKEFLENNREQLELETSDISDWIITDHHKSRTSGAVHIYIRQILQGIEVNNGVANFAIKNGKVMSMGNRLIGQLASKARYSSSSITPTQAVEKAAEQLQIDAPTNLRIVEPLSKNHLRACLNLGFS